MTSTWVEANLCPIFYTRMAVIQPKTPVSIVVLVPPLESIFIPVMPMNKHPKLVDISDITHFHF